ncbi:MAG: restriction endonuclease subunit S [Nitrospirota bacterium]
MSEGWPEKPLSELATITMGQSPESSCINASERGLPFLQGCAEFGARVPSATSHCSPPLRVAKSGSVLISVRAPVGTTNLADQDYCIGRGLGAVSARQDLADNVFLLHAIEQNVGFLHRRSQGSTFLAVGAKELSALPVPAISLRIQRRIAEILSTVDETIEQTEALIAKYQQIKAGLMHDLFTRGLTPDGRLRPTRAQAPHLYKDSPLGWIPKEWECLSIGELFTRRVERGKAGLPVMAITMYGGLVERDSVDRRIESKLSPEGHLLVRRGDIAYNMMRMWQGVLGRAQYDCLVSPAYIVLTPSPSVDSAFAEYLLSNNAAVAMFKRRSYGVVDDRLRLYFRDLIRIQLAVPRKINEQIAISERLMRMDETIKRMVASVEKLRQLKHGLMHDLLTGRVRVRVADSAGG